MANMNSLQFFFHNAWRWHLGMPELTEEYHDANPKGTVPDIDEIKKHQFGSLFTKLMDARMVMGFFRYGNRMRILDKEYHLRSVEKRIESYKLTGNLEFLVDAGNFLRMEFDRPLYRTDAYFKSIDDGEHSK
jgi:hypothetical protein